MWCTELINTSVRTGQRNLVDGTNKIEDNSSCFAKVYTVHRLKNIAKKLEGLESGKGCMKIEYKPPEYLEDKFLL